MFSRLLHMDWYRGGLGMEILKSQIKYRNLDFPTKVECTSEMCSYEKFRSELPATSPSPPASKLDQTTSIY